MVLGHLLPSQVEEPRGRGGGGRQRVDAPLQCCRSAASQCLGLTGRRRRRGCAAVRRSQANVGEAGRPDLRSRRSAAARHAGGPWRAACLDRKSVVSGKSVSVRVDLGGRRIIKKKTIKSESQGLQTQLK